jgi:hypothetical protein
VGSGSPSRGGGGCRHGWQHPGRQWQEEGECSRSGPHLTLSVHTLQSGAASDHVVRKLAALRMDHHHHHYGQLRRHGARRQVAVRRQDGPLHSNGKSNKRHWGNNCLIIEGAFSVILLCEEKNTICYMRVVVWHAHDHAACTCTRDNISDALLQYIIIPQ